ncbi:MAG: hypothetical protein QM611_01555 [Microbacterium sp.]|uniref:hypothetical protein n=1 Tax=Microbacterium sp. TaxID=51671 RepID=UPI0039E60E8F
MSTDGTRRGRALRRRQRAFAGALAGVLGVLAVLGLAGGAVSAVQGPRVTQVQVDPAASTQASGSRVIFTTNQSLQPVDVAQVDVEPAAPFLLDTVGRSVGLRFTLPLRDDTDYTVRISDVAGLGGGPTTTIVERFHTPPLSAFVLRRSSGGDTIVRTDLEGRAQTVFEHSHIEDFRATSGHLVISTLDDEGNARLLVTDLEGQNERELPMPGPGTVMSLQAADRGELIGYTFSDANLGEGGGRESALYVASAKESAKDDPPTAVAVPGDETRVADWRFVPDTDSILVLTYDSRMLLSGADGADATDLGNGVAIDGIARGSSVAIVQRSDDIYRVDLTDGAQTPLAPAKGVVGAQGVITPIPGEGAGTVRQFLQVDAALGEQVTNVYRVDDDGATTELATVPAGDAVMQTCVSPSGRYVALLVAPSIVDNTYDTYLMPMPRQLETRILELADGSEVATIPGFGLSWCQTPPPLSQ